MKIESEHYLHIVPSMRSNPRLSAEIHEQLSRHVDFSEGIDDVRQLPLVIIFRPQGRPDDEFSEIVEPLAQTRQDRKRDKLLITALSSSRQGQKFNPKVSSLRFKAIWTIYVLSGSLDIKSSLSTIYNLASFFVTEYGFKKKSQTQATDQRTGAQTGIRKRESNLTDIPHISPKTQRLLPSTTTITQSEIFPLSQTSDERRISGFADVEEPETYTSGVVETSQNEEWTDDTSLPHTEITPGRNEDRHNDAESSSHHANVEGYMQTHAITEQPSRAHGMMSQQSIFPQLRTLYSTEIQQSETGHPLHATKVKDDPYKMELHKPHSVITEQPVRGYGYMSDRRMVHQTDDTQQQPIPVTERSRTEGRESGPGGTYTVSSITGRGVTSQVEYRSSQYELPHSPNRQASPNRNSQLLQQTSSNGEESLYTRGKYDSGDTGELKTFSPWKEDIRNIVSGGTIQRPPHALQSSDPILPQKDITHQKTRLKDQDILQEILDEIEQGGYTFQATIEKKFKIKCGHFPRIIRTTLEEVRIPPYLSRSTVISDILDAKINKKIEEQFKVGQLKDIIKTALTFQAIKSALDQMDNGDETVQKCVESKYKVRSGLLPRILRTSLEELKISSSGSGSTEIKDFLSSKVKRRIEGQYKLEKGSWKNIIEETSNQYLELQRTKAKDDHDQEIIREAQRQMEDGDEKVQVIIERKHNLKPGRLPRILDSIIEDPEKMSTTVDPSDTKNYQKSLLKRKIVEDVTDEYFKVQRRFEETQESNKELKELIQKAYDRMHMGDETVQKQVETKFEIRAGNLPRILDTTLKELEKRLELPGLSETTLTVQRIIEEQYGLKKGSLKDIVMVVAHSPPKRSRSSDKKSSDKRNGDKKSRDKKNGDKKSSDRRCVIQ